MDDFYRNKIEGKTYFLVSPDHIVCNEDDAKVGDWRAVMWSDAAQLAEEKRKIKQNLDLLCDFILRGDTGAAMQLVRHLRAEAND